MAYWHCTECHHEWESVSDVSCDWCGCPGYVLEDATPLQLFIRMMNNEKSEIFFDILSIRKEGRRP
jgi:hypothetical protein